MEVVTVRIDTDEGISGYGYTYTDGYGGRSIKRILDTDIFELVKGMNPLEIKKIVKKVLWEIRGAGFSGVTVIATTGLELALWDIKSKVYGRPLGDLLDAYTDKIPMYASIAGWTTLPVEEMIERADELVKEKKLFGIKIQVGRLPIEKDEYRIKKLRETLGSETKLFIDANTVLDVPSAIKLGKRLQDYDIFWFEEPIPPNDVDGFLQIGEHIDIPLATGEQLFGIHECEELIRRRAVSFMQADLMHVGGITEWLRIASYAECHGLKMSPHFIMEMSTEILCAIRNSQFVEYIPWFQKYFKEPIKLEDGYAFARKKIGLGLEFDEAAIKTCRTE